MSDSLLKFDDLVTAIRSVNQQLAFQARQAVNVSLTLRNWLIGHYISEYLLHGADRAKYGEKAVPALAERLKDVPTCETRRLYLYLRFFQTYPQIVRTVSAQFKNCLLSVDCETVRTVSAELKTSIQKLLEHLSYSQFELLIQVENPEARAFYETECLRGNWSVRELKRQIGSLYYERTGLSRNPSVLAEQTGNKAETRLPALNIRDPYVFEFLGLKPLEVMTESDLENQLIGKLEYFLLEMGRGFCFEARQKRILIGGEFFFVNLVFYHRILKCHVLIELKAEPFSHENIGQLNTYVNYYRKNEMTAGDNPPIGILLCTGKNNALVEYALAGLDQRLFVSKYLLELPPKETMEAFLRRELDEISPPEGGGK